MPDLVCSWSDLQRAVQKQARTADSPIHGIGHWSRVAENAVSMFLTDGSGDLAVAFVFSLLHDAARTSDGASPNHGRHAAVLANGFYRQRMFWLDGNRMAKLLYALENHDRPSCRQTHDPIVALCWDADRLELPRVGTRIDPAYISSPAGRSMVDRRNQALDIP